MASDRQYRRLLGRDLQPKLIAHFMAVASHLSVSRAARTLNLTQSAVSKSIKTLQDRLGVDLIERTPHGIRLTSYGEAFARRGRRIESELNDSLRELRVLKEGTVGTLRIGAGLVWSQKLLPPIVARFQALHPGVKVILQTGVISTLVPDLTSGELDLLCVTLDFPDSPSLVKQRLIDVQHAIFARAGHPLLRRARVLPQELAAYSWVALHNDYVGFSRLAAFAAASGLPPPTIRVEVPADLSIIAMLTASDYLGSLPLALQEMARSMGVVPVPVRDAQLWNARAGIAYRTTSHPGVLLNNFMTLLRESFEA